MREDLQQPKQLHLCQRFWRRACGPLVARASGAGRPDHQEDLAKLGPNYLAQEITERVAKAPQRWTMVVTVADPGDPTADPSIAWPPGRRAVEVGTLVVQRIEGERDGPCRDINFDPTILPNGVHVSDDPFPSARSAAYAVSYDLRTSELKYYPYHSELREAGNDDQRRQTFYRSSALPALADGRLYSGDAIHRRRHEFDRRAEISAASRDA